MACMPKLKPISPKELIKIIDSEPLAMIDYVKICDTDTLEDVLYIKDKALLAIAVWVSRARLIDNCILGDTMKL